MNDDLLKRGLEALSPPADGPLFSGLSRYGAAIEEWNPAYGLVGAEGDELVIKHLLDSLAPLAEIRARLESVAAAREPGAKADAPDGAAATTAGAAGAPAGAAPDLSRLSLADLGTGAGLPGIPLALALPEVRVSLVDRMTRRIRFLEAMRDALPLPNVEIVEEQVEHAKGRYDLIIFRAFRPFERKLFKRVFALCAPDGFVVAYKGRADKAAGELPEIAGLYASAEILPVKVPFLDDERCLVVLRPAR